MLMVFEVFSFESEIDIILSNEEAQAKFGRFMTKPVVWKRFRSWYQKWDMQKHLPLSPWLFAKHSHGGPNRPSPKLELPI